MSEEKAEPWDKVLYKNQGKPDNYVHYTFLRDLKKNAFIRHYTYREAIIGAATVSSEISNVCILFVIHNYLKEGALSSSLLLALLAILTVIGYVWCLFKISISFISDVKNVAIFSAFGYGMSPVLKTLTDTISSNTIHDASIGMMIVHLMFYDYADSAENITSSSIAFNAAIFSAVCLASRLHTVFDAFVFLTLAVELFALIPLFRKHFKTVYATKGELLLFASSSHLALCAVYSISKLWTGILFVILVFITFVCPFWYTRWQHYKDNIYGPWDEAVINEQDLKENGNLIADKIDC